MICNFRLELFNSDLGNPNLCVKLNRDITHLGNPNFFSVSKLLCGTMKRSGSDAAVMGRVISRASVRVYPSNQNVKPIDNKGKGKQPLIIKKLPPVDAPRCSSSTVKLESKSGLIIKMNKKRMMGVVADDTRSTKRFKPSKITYSRMDMESMRFVNFAEQRDLCNWIPQELIFKSFLVPKTKTPPNAPTPMRELILAARNKLDEINAERSNKHKPKWIRDRQEFRLMIQEVERRALARPLFQDNVQIMTDIYKLIRTMFKS